MATSENTLRSGMDGLKISDSAKASMAETKADSSKHCGKAWRHCHKNTEGDCGNKKCHKQTKKWMKMMSKCEKQPWCGPEGYGGVPPQCFTGGFIQGAAGHHPAMWGVPPPAYHPQFYTPMMGYGGPGFNQFEGDMPGVQGRRPWFYPPGMCQADPKMWKKFRKHCCKKDVDHNTEPTESKSTAGSETEKQNMESTSRASCPVDKPSCCEKNQFKEEKKEERKRGRIMQNVMAMNMMSSGFPAGSGYSAVYGVHPGFWYGCNRKNWRKCMADSSSGSSSSSSDEEFVKVAEKEKPMDN